MLSNTISSPGRPSGDIPRPPRGFTLIELLTVIAIIGILASILIPVLSRVRQSASQAVATSNMREIGTSVHTFAADNNDRLPGMHQTLGGQPDPSYELGGGQSAYATNTRWSLGHADQLGPYIGSHLAEIDGQERLYNPLLESPALARSRAHNQFPTTHLRSERVADHTGRRLLPSPFGNGRADPGARSMSMRYSDLDRYFTPSLRWMLIEIDDEMPIDIVRDAGGTWPWSVPPRTLHGTGWVTLMWDGSVAFLQRGDARLDNQRQR